MAGVEQASAEVQATRSGRLHRPDHGGDGSSYRAVNGPQSGSRQTREEPIDGGLDQSANVGGGEKWSYIRFYMCVHVCIFPSIHPPIQL